MIYHNGAGIMGGIGEGLERGSSQILNAVMMKKRLEMAKQAADTERMKTQADVRRSDAYTNYLNNQDIMKQLDAAHADVPAWLERKRAQKAVPGPGPGSSANQLATLRVTPPNVRIDPSVTRVRGAQQADPRMLVSPDEPALYADGE
ncbi:MAG TPA: hypothetical protein DCQ94_09705 [Nitrospira sp.]|nr:hypothetical protein [Nitrospira sp.]